MIERTTRAGLWSRLVWRGVVVLTALLVLFLSSVTWLWDEFIRTPRPPVIQFFANLHWYGVAIVGMVLLVVVIGEAAYQVIRKAEGNLESANEIIARHDDGRPRIALEVLAPSGESNWATMSGSCGPFWIRNYGTRTARMVQFDPIPAKTRKWVLQLEEVSLLSTTERAPLGFHLCDDIEGQWTRLRLFFEDTPKRRCVVTYPIRITFLDTNNEQLEERLILESNMPECKFRIYPAPRPQ